jgi:hypothetical protein
VAAVEMVDAEEVVRVGLGQSALSSFQWPRLGR